jgi:hypothetical protein
MALSRKNSTKPQKKTLKKQLKTQKTLKNRNLEKPLKNLVDDEC